ncbi:hypothetical protein PV328_006764 [Microctonus aethiopoides]|uniref:Uncharacterized protein n=1 Tax=Microctonus aethiopoides TaxID=144406 RepID=A0AA39KU08_9HYME|nr:hypothetical protein PV328_006764 [Microctonus aethiopoides]
MIPVSSFIYLILEMDEFCPLCRKNGCNSKIKPVQINFHEAVYLCESKTCQWPYGYEEFKIIQRSIDEMGNISPKKSNNSKSEFQKAKDGTQIIPISAELSMYTPPVTPSNDSTSSKELVKGGSYASINNSTSKSAIAAIKSDNKSPKIPSIFDIDSSVLLSTKKVDESQNVLNCCDIKNDDETINKSMLLSDECHQTPSNQILINIPQKPRDIKHNEIKLKNKIKTVIVRKSISRLIPEQLCDQSDTKLDRKVVIFKEKSTNAISLSEDKKFNNSINRKRPNDDNGNQIVIEKIPKKFSKVSWNQGHYNKNNDTFCELSNELLMNNSTSLIKSKNDDIVINDNMTENKSSIVNNTVNDIVNFPSADSKEFLVENNSVKNIVNVPSIESKESSIIDNNFGTFNNISGNSFSGDNSILENFLDENFLDNCPNTTQEIDDDWLESLLM